MFQLMYNAPEASPINDTILDALVNALDLKQWAYVRAEIEDATRVQFMSSIFERVAYMFKDEDADKTPSHKSIRDRVRHILTKNEDLKEGSTQRILGMEMAADNSNEERVYGIVTTDTSRRFLKRTDDRIEMFKDVIYCATI
ncbi:hypothetical protein JG688_00015217 [Phytophthora aleatoria]|uniref:Uncharacterized protein n=1 Tax=Phytophthora aleatoria TaxID=2496075 RepID=A0A8J5MDJ0_9STRA|nr:hypothetical protein JG688_00015217 [Phytophthora aleatoria]